MSGKGFQFTLDGRTWSVDAKKAAMLQRLKEAMVGIAEGETAHTGILEVREDGLYRMFYMVANDDGYDRLITDWAEFQKFITNEAVLKQGSAPPDNRSVAKN